MITLILSLLLNVAHASECKDAPQFNAIKRSISGDTNLDWGWKPIGDGPDTKQHAMCVFNVHTFGIVNCTVLSDVETSKLDECD